MQAMAAKDKAWKAWRNDINNNQLRQQPITAINHAVRVLNQSRLAKEASVRARLSKGSMRDKEWWSCGKTVGGARRSSTIPLLVDTSGGKHASSKGKADCLASYFANKCSLGRHDLQEEQLPPLPQPSTPLVSFIHFRPPEVRRLLERLNTSKATGPDTISPRVLKECSKELATPLAKLFALCFHTGVQPDMWKTLNVVPIPKRSSKVAVCNYRPVSLLSVSIKGDGDHYQQAADEPSGSP